MTVPGWYIRGGLREAGNERNNWRWELGPFTNPEAKIVAHLFDADEKVAVVPRLSMTRKNLRARALYRSRHREDVLRAICASAMTTGHPNDAA